MEDAIRFYNEHQELVWAIVWLVLTMVFNIATRFKTPEQWVEFGEKYPRIQNLIRLMRAVGIDPVKAIRALGAFLSGKSQATKTDRPSILKDVEPGKLPSSTTDKEN
jgi:hypothetical protein